MIEFSEVGLPFKEFEEVRFAPVYMVQDGKKVRRPGIISGTSLVAVVETHASGVLATIDFGDELRSDLVKLHEDVLGRIPKARAHYQPITAEEAASLFGDYLRGNLAAGQWMVAVGLAVTGTGRTVRPMEGDFALLRRVQPGEVVDVYRRGVNDRRKVLVQAR